MSDKVHVSQGDSKILFERTNANILGAGVSDLGTVQPVLGYSHISGYVFSDVDSATVGIVIEQAGAVTDFPSGALATEGVTRSIQAIFGGDQEDNALAVQIVAPFARISYINGGTAQTKYRAFFAARLIRGL